MEKMLGVMIDCSRNAVMNTETVKRYAKILKKMGYNTLMLYTEDTYEVDNQPFFGHLRGRYSKSELKELAQFCDDLGIELVPCIQTLAHLNCMFKWNNVYKEINDCDDILLVSEEKTYELIEDMFSTIAQCFTSRKIHIGMDEAYRVGTGKYQQLHGIEDRFNVINKHLHRVCEIADKYGFEPMIWSDMFCKLALNIESQYEHVDASKIIEKAKLPENITLVYWDYYSSDQSHYEQMIKMNKMFGRKVIFAGGAWTWNSFAPDNAYSLEITKAAVLACDKCTVDGMFMTLWGDDGSECSKFAVLPALMYAAEASKGNKDINSIKAKFKEIVGYEFDDFMMLDKLDIINEKHTRGSSKYIFYNDLFMGIRDFKCSEEDTKYYAELSEKINTEQGEYSYIFDTYKKLAEILKIKSTLGIRTRKAYLEKNYDELKRIIGDYELLYELLEEFYYAHQKQWFEENKPHGFEVEDVRLGGLQRRIKSCKERLSGFINGEIKEIPELLEPVLDEINGKDQWGRIITANSPQFGN